MCILMSFKMSLKNRQRKTVLKGIIQITAIIVKNITTTTTKKNYYLEIKQQTTGDRASPARDLHIHATHSRVKNSVHAQLILSICQP